MNGPLHPGEVKADSAGPRGRLGRLLLGSLLAVCHATWDGPEGNRGGCFFVRLGTVQLPRGDTPRIRLVDIVDFLP